MKQPYRVLDAKRIGNEACSVRNKLSRLVIGQDEAIEQIVNIYEMHVIGLAAPGGPSETFCFWVLLALAKHGPLKPWQRR